MSAMPPLRGLVTKAAVLVAAAFIWVWTTINSRHSLSGWAVLVFGLFALFGIVAALFLLATSLFRPYRNYVEDMIDEAIWRWSWSKKGITNLGVSAQIAMGNLSTKNVADARILSVNGALRPTERGRRAPYDRPSVRVVTTIPARGRWKAIGVIEREIPRRVRTEEFREKIQ